MQPWAWLILRPDLVDIAERVNASAEHLVKDVENRSWYARHRGDFYVHAGKTFDLEAFDALKFDDIRYGWLAGTSLRAKLLTMSPTDFQRGGIVGRARLVDCLTDSQSPWYSGEFALVLADPEPLPFRPLRGQLMFFDVPND